MKFLSNKIRSSSRNPRYSHINEINVLFISISDFLESLTNLFLLPRRDFVRLFMFATRKVVRAFFIFFILWDHETELKRVCKRDFNWMYQNERSNEESKNNEKKYWITNYLSSRDLFIGYFNKTRNNHKFNWPTRCNQWSQPMSHSFFSISSYFFRVIVDSTFSILRL